MANNERDRLADIAQTHCWTVTPGDAFHGGRRPNGNEVVAYERYSTQILIEWTPLGEATSIVKNPHNADEIRAQGSQGLLDARTWLQAPP